MMKKAIKDQFIIIMPAYNEADNIAPIVRSIRKFGFKNILVVDDGSTDSTTEIVKKLKIQSLRHPVNLGLGAALRTGFEWVIMSNKFKYVITLDSDGQHQAQDVIRIAKKILKDYDLVIGTRNFFNKNVPINRLVINYLADLLTFFLSGKFILDTQSGLRCFTLRALEQLDLYSIRYSISSEIIIKSIQNDLKIGKVNIDAIYTEKSLKEGQSLLGSIEIITNLLSQNV